MPSPTTPACTACVALQRFMCVSGQGTSKAPYKCNVLCTWRAVHVMGQNRAGAGFTGSQARGLHLFHFFDLGRKRPFHASFLDGKSLNKLKIVGLVSHVFCPSCDAAENSPWLYNFPLLSVLRAGPEWFWWRRQVWNFLAGYRVGKHPLVSSVHRQNNEDSETGGDNYVMWGAASYRPFRSCSDHPSLPGNGGSSYRPGKAVLASWLNSCASLWAICGPGIIEDRDDISWGAVPRTPSIMGSWFSPPREGGGREGGGRGGGRVYRDKIYRGVFPPKCRNVLNDCRCFL